MPTDLAGPRLVVNVRVPPAPPGLTAQAHLLGRIATDGGGGGGGGDDDKRLAEGGRPRGVRRWLAALLASTPIPAPQPSGALSPLETPRAYFCCLPPGPNLASKNDEEEYDESLEAWQYLAVAVAGCFTYTLRLPKGLQHRGIPMVRALANGEKKRNARPPRCVRGKEGAPLLVLRLLNVLYLLHASRVLSGPA
jgi:hypothetical protein